MSYAQITSISTTREWLQTQRFIPWLDMLHFPIEAQVILTPFRERVLSYIYRTARGLSEGLLESAIVEAISEPDEDDSLHLNLAMTFKMEWEEIDKLHDRILEKVAEWSKEWSHEYQQDYGRWIFFSLTPANV